jgi:tetratricopeptide (TPR) repeat protein
MKTVFSSMRLLWALWVIACLSQTSSLLSHLQANLGFLALTDQQPAKAEQSFKRAIHIDTRLVSAWDGLGQALMAQGKTSDALQAYDMALSLQPKRVLARLRRADARQILGDYTGAQDDWRSIGSVDLLLTLGHQARTNEDSALAIMFYRLATETAPQDWHGYCFMAAVLYAEERFEEAQTWLQAGLELSPDNATMLLRGGRIEYALQHYKQALHMFSRYVELFPDEFLGWYWRGLCWEELGLTDQAMRDYQMAIVKNPADQNPHLRLARVLERVGDREAALLEFQAVLDILPENDESLRAVERLQAEP